MIIIKYLFYDLEFATSKGGESKICEFGYVRTDETFNIIERDNLIIDPEIIRKDWNYRVVKNILRRSISEYEKKPSFYSYYETIKEIITSSDYVIGHTIDGDAKALCDDCLRYCLESIDYDFYDVKEIYKGYFNTKCDVALVKILEELNIKGETKIHDAGTDSYNTMLVLKDILDKMNISFEDLIKKYPSAKGTSKDYIIEFNAKNEDTKIAESIEKIEECNIGTKKKKKVINLYLKELNSLTTENTIFHNITFSISPNYYEKYFKQALNLIKLIYDAGGCVNQNVSLSNIMIKYDIYLSDGSIKTDSMLEHVKNDNFNGTNIEIMDLKKLLDKLNITEEQLNAMPMIPLDFVDTELEKEKEAKINKRKERINNVKKNINKSSNEKTTLGDLFPEFFKVKS